MSGEIIQYKTEDGVTVIRLQARDGNVWLSQADMAELFETTVSNVNKHIHAIIEEGEQPEATIERYSIVRTEGGRSVERQVAHYSLPMILRALPRRQRQYFPSTASCFVAAPASANAQ